MTENILELIKLLEFGDADQRAKAAIALIGLNDKRAIEPLRRAASDLDSIVRRNVAEALQNYNETAPLLKQESKSSEQNEDPDRKRIVEQVKNAISKNKPGTATREERGLGDQTTLYTNTLVDGELWIKFEMAVATSYFHDSTQVKFKDVVVFTARARNNIYIKGEWEEQLSNLAS